MKKLILASAAAVLAMSVATPAMACEMMRSVDVDLAPMQVTVADPAAEPVKQAGETAPVVAKTEPVAQAAPKMASEIGDGETELEVAQSGLSKAQ